MKRKRGNTGQSMAKTEEKREIVETGKK